MSTTLTIELLDDTAYDVQVRTADFETGEVELGRRVDKTLPSGSKDVVTLETFLLEYAVATGLPLAAAESTVDEQALAAYENHLDVIADLAAEARADARREGGY